MNQSVMGFRELQKLFNPWKMEERSGQERRKNWRFLIARQPSFGPAIATNHKTMRRDAQPKRISLTKLLKRYSRPYARENDFESSTVMEVGLP